MIAHSGRRRSRLLILCYHGISLRDEHAWLPLMYVTPAQFRQRLEILKSTDATVLPLEEALERLRTSSLPTRSVVITFDDGFYDFLHHAVPALTEFGYPCTLYQTTHYSGYRAPIFTLVVSYLLWKAGRPVADLSPFGLSSRVSVRTWEERAAVAGAMLDLAQARQMGTVAKDEEARRLAEHLEIDYDELVRSRLLQLLSPEEIARVSGAGIDIQLHTHRHRTPLDRTLFLREIQDNRDRIHDYTGRHAAHFCYPSGVHAPEFLPWLAEAAVKSATTCELGLATKNSDPLLLPRFLDDNRIGTLEFESWLCGLRA